MSVFDLVNGFVPAVTEVKGVAEFERVLSHWVNVSDGPTVGFGGSRPGSPVILVRLGADRFALNRDTKRPAVRAFLAAAARAGGAAELSWHVTFNQDGKVNRVSYRSDNERTPGWYAYLDPAADEPRTLG
jgi:hypothetical protein